jgi:hypothetical protein
MTGTMTTSQVRPNETRVLSCPLRDGIHDEGLDLEATQAGGNHNPNDRDRAPPAPQDNKAIKDPGAATNSCMMPQETRRR